MLRNPFKTAAASAVLLAALTAAGSPRPDPVAARVQGYKDLGTVYKAITDAVRQGSLGGLPSLAGRVVTASQAQYTWYPAQSRPRPGVKTDAKPEIWSRGADFRAAQDRFALQAQLFQRAAASADATAIRNASRQLGASCKGCHDGFRIERD